MASREKYVEDVLLRIDTRLQFFTAYLKIIFVATLRTQLPSARMNRTLFNRAARTLVPTLALVASAAANAEMFPEGILGMKLGQTRIEALTALVEAGGVPELEKAQCSDKVPEKNRLVANRICKLTLQPGTSQYLGLSVAKVTFLFQGEAIVLIGLYLSSPTECFSALRASYGALWGEPSKETASASANWREAVSGASEPTAQVQLYADTVNAFVVYSFGNVQ